ncbi:MAG: hypothetical protein JWM37_308 [Candidatus Saccharibacteria bacterium]|nr:hypothetical protein [Candidatus Saccharibacteria bacterium]
MAENLSFQYCQKLVVLNQELDSVLLAKRKGEADFDGVFSFIGGKMETTDETLLAGMQREKNEEVGDRVSLKVLPKESYNLLFRKQDGNSMVLPHAACVYEGGEISLNEEYSEYAWVEIDQLDSFEPKIETVVEAAAWALGRLSVATESDFVRI